MSDEHDERREVSIELPLGLMTSLGRERDRMRMTYQEKRVTLDRMLESLGVEELMALRFMLAGDPEMAAVNNAAFDGMIYSILRLKHGVDPDNGKRPEDLFEELD